MKNLKPLLISIFITIPTLSFGITTISTTINFFNIMVLTGGLSFFLYGMQIGAKSLKSSRGNKLIKNLQKMTTNRTKSVSLGIIMTAFTQSSSATSVILVSLVNSEIFTLAQTLPILLGAGIGTSITVQLIAFKLSNYALIFVSLGIFLGFSKKREGIKIFSNLLLAFGLIFYGMHLMSVGLEPLKNSPELPHILLAIKNMPWVALLISTIITTIMQSSGAVIAILISISIGNISGESTTFLTASIPIIFGANLGTCITAFIGSIGTKREAKRVALAQLIQKSGGILLFMFFIPIFVTLAQATGFGDSAREIANGHLIFNILLVFLMLPLQKQILKLISKILPIKENEIPFHSKYIDYSMLSTPSLALIQAKKEILREGKIISQQISKITALFGDAKLAKAVKNRDEDADTLHKEIAKYLNQLQTSEINLKIAIEAENLFYINTDLESIGDIVVKDIIPLTKKFNRKKLCFSNKGQEELQILNEKVSHQLDLLLFAFKNNSRQEMENIIKNSKYLQKKIDYFRKNHLNRLIEGHDKSIETSTIHIDLVSYFRNIDIEITRIAKGLLKGQNND